MDRTLTLPDTTALSDLSTYLSRADRVDRASVRLVAAGGVLAVYTAVLHPSGLLGEPPTGLVWRCGQRDPETGPEAPVSPTRRGAPLRHRAKVPIPNRA